MESEQPDDTRTKIQIQRDARLILDAAEGNWAPSFEDQQKILRDVVGMAVDPKVGARERIRAAEFVRKCKKDDADKLMKVLDKLVPDQVSVDHTHHTTDAKGEVSELLNNADYLEYLREKAVGEDCDTGIVCAPHDGGNGRALANGSTPKSLGSGTNGHRNWRERPPDNPDATPSR